MLHKLILYTTLNILSRSICCEIETESVTFYFYTMLSTIDEKILWKKGGNHITGVIHNSNIKYECDDDMIYSVALTS